MDPEEILSLIEGVEDVLQPEAKGLEAFYRQFVCPVCASPCHKEYHPGHMFRDPNVLNPRAILRCNSCRHLFDPHSGLTVELGEQPKIATPR